MSWFEDEDDPFEDIVRNFFTDKTRGSRQQKVITGEDDERVIDLVESKDKFFLVFEVPGYTKEDIEISVRGNKIQIITKKKNLENVQDYLKRKLGIKTSLVRTLPDSVNNKKFDYQVNNGILEVMFKKK